jgi:hypothetical protein
VGFSCLFLCLYHMLYSVHYCGVVVVSLQDLVHDVPFLDFIRVGHGVSVDSVG